MWPRCITQVEDAVPALAICHAHVVCVERFLQLGSVLLRHCLNQS